MKNKTAGPALIILAAVLWGSMGIFVRILTGYGLSSIQIVCVRLVFACPLLIAMRLLLEPAAPLPKLRDMPLFAAIGIGSVVFFTVCYFSAMRMMSLSAAAVLLYTSPIWVMIMSCIFFKEKLTGKKAAALIGAFAGCALISFTGEAGLTLPGVLVGLGAGLGYGLYSILGTVALRRHSSLTVTACVFFFAAIGSVLLCLNSGIIRILFSGPDTGKLILLAVLSGTVTVVIPYSCYTKGLETVEASRAAIIATVEPLVATVIGVVIFREELTLVSVIGIVLILGSVILLNFRKK